MDDPWEEGSHRSLKTSEGKEILHLFMTGEQVMLVSRESWDRILKPLDPPLDAGNRCGGLRTPPSHAKLRSAKCCAAALRRYGRSPVSAREPIWQAPATLISNELLHEAPKTGLGAGIR